MAKSKISDTLTLFPGVNAQKPLDFVVVFEDPKRPQVFFPVECYYITGNLYFKQFSTSVTIETAAVILKELEAHRDAIENAFEDFVIENNLY